MAIRQVTGYKFETIDNLTITDYKYFCYIFLKLLIELFKYVETENEKDEIILIIHKIRCLYDTNTFKFFIIDTDKFLYFIEQFNKYKDKLILCGDIYKDYYEKHIKDFEKYYNTAKEQDLEFIILYGIKEII